METTVSDLCRGAGKVYFRLTAAGLGTGERLGFAAFLRGGEEVPLMMFPLESDSLMGAVSDQREYLGVLPLADCGIRLIAFAFDGAGAPLCESSHLITPLGARLSSYVNTALHGSSLQHVRNGEVERTEGRIIYDFLHLAVVEDEGGRHRFLRGVARVPACWSDDALDLRFLDSRLHEVGWDPCCYPLPQGEGDSRRLWGFSVMLPDGLKGLTVFAIGGDGAMNRGFASLDENMLKALEREGAFFNQPPGYVESLSSWWRARYCNRTELQRQRETSFAEMPVFSIVVPLYKTPIPLFQEMLRSVQDQTYGRWELLLVNASPEDGELARAVAQAAEADNRIVVVELEENRGITLNTNEGIKRATGDFIAFFDHDDVLAPGLLFAYAQTVNEHPDTDLLYCDEIKLTMGGVLTEPNFKPDFSWDMLRNNNYICHMLTVRASLLRTLPLQGSEFDGAQDHNLTLMVAEAGRRMHHVPEALYLWRKAPGSTAGNPESKRYAAEAGKRAVRVHLQRLGVKAQVDDDISPFTYRVVYEVAENPLVSLVTVADGRDSLERCVRSFLQVSAYDAKEAVVVADGRRSPAEMDRLRRLAESDSRVRLVCPAEPFKSSAAAWNRGAAEAAGGYLLFADNALEAVEPAWLEELLGICQQKGVGAVAPLAVHPDGSFCDAGMTVSEEGPVPVNHGLSRGFRRWLCRRNWQALSGTCLMTPAEALRGAGGFDEGFAGEGFVFDYCLKLCEAGYRLVSAPDIEVLHYALPTFRSEAAADRMAAIADRSLMLTRWGKVLGARDPFYNDRLFRRGPADAFFHLDTGPLVRG